MRILILIALAWAAIFALFIWFCARYKRVMPAYPPMPDPAEVIEGHTRPRRNAPPEEFLGVHGQPHDRIW